MTSRTDRRLTSKNYPEAVQAYGEALKAVPGDAVALKGQGDATAAFRTGADRKQRETQHAAIAEEHRRDALAGVNSTRPSSWPTTRWNCCRATRRPAI